MMPIQFNNTYRNLGENFFVETLPEAVRKPQLIKFNTALADDLGLLDTNLNPANNTADSIAILAGNLIPEGAQPLAMAYAGHQFGQFNPQLGDGRAILLGEVSSPNGVHVDLQLKGSGRTHFSRGGDGRAALGPVIREYLLSEAMAKLSVPTTRALAVVSSGEDVARQQLLPGGIITRVSKSFVRVGTFQYFAANENETAVKKLADFMIERDYPTVKLKYNDNIYANFLTEIVTRQAQLMAKWMQVGFIHGVMNTDNTSIVGETIDYGPCAFMDYFNQHQVYSSIDRNGRYAYSNQASIALWNLTRLAETMLPLLHNNTDAAVDIAQDILKNFIQQYQQYWLDGMRQKVGFSSTQNEDKKLLDEWFDCLETAKADFTLSFYYLSQLNSQPSSQDEKVFSLFAETEQINVWLQKWRQRLNQESSIDKKRQIMMQAVNPVYIPRNHLLEAAIRAAEDRGDFSVFEALHEVLQNPFEYQEGKQQYMLPPKPNEVVHQTFCGT